jgi:hypothetical protein
MGLFDGQDQKRLANSYSNDLNSLRSQQEIAMLKAQAQMYNKAAAAQHGQYGQALSGSKSSMFAPDRERINPNESEAFQIPLSQLVTMWQVRFGDQWLDDDKTFDEQFYSEAKLRLDHNKLFERFDGYLRLKENAETLLANR